MYFSLNKWFDTARRMALFQPLYVLQLISKFAGQIRQHTIYIKITLNIYVIFSDVNIYSIVFLHHLKLTIIRLKKKCNSLSEILNEVLSNAYCSR